MTISAGVPTVTTYWFPGLFMRGMMTMLITVFVLTVVVLLFYGGLHLSPAWIYKRNRGAGGLLAVAIMFRRASEFFYSSFKEPRTQASVSKTCGHYWARSVSLSASEGIITSFPNRAWPRF
jgi:hypothetical protein